MMNLKLVLINVLAGMLGWGCVSKNDFSHDDPSPATISIAHLKSLYRSGPRFLSEEAEIRGVVTGNDIYNALPHTLVVQDESSAVEIKVSGEELFVMFPLGTRVWVHARGLTLGNYGGVISLGTPSENPDFENGFIPMSMLAQYIQPYGQQVEILPDTLLFSELTPSRISRYVAFRRVQFIDGESAQPWCDPQRDTDRHLVDPAGDTLIVRTSCQADFAYRTLPSGSGYIEGILSVFNRRYQLRVVTVKGVVMNQPRFTPHPK